MKKILTVSIMAVMAVTAANAEIASKAYVDQRETAAVNTAKGYTDTKIGTLPAGSTDVADAIAKAVTGGTEGVVKRSGTAAVGSATVPVYVNASGVVTPTTLGSMATENAADYTKTGLDTTYAKASDFTTLQSAVNNTETGLAATKAIADANKTAIGDANSGLTKGVADNAAAIAALGDTYATDAELTAGLGTKQNTIDAEHKLSSSLVDGLGTMAAESKDDYYTKTAADSAFVEAPATAVTAGTYPKVTVDAQGLVTAGASLAETDIPALSISKVTNLQTTLDGKQDNIGTATGSDGVYVLTGTISGDSVTYKWEQIQRGTGE